MPNIEYTLDGYETGPVEKSDSPNNMPNIGYTLDDHEKGPIEISASPTNMPNIGYTLDGYDLMKGNPLTTGANIDPGYRQSIFDASYTGKAVTADQRYKIPDGMEIKSCDGSCSMSFGSTSISGAQKYQSTLEEKVSADFEGWGASFSASVDYKKVSTSTKNQSTFVTQSDVSCCAYVTSILHYEPPPLSNNFLKGVDTLPQNFEKKPYREFIKNFGTHYIKEATMGALYGQRSFVSSESWEKMVEQDINIDVSAGYSGINKSFSRFVKIKIGNSTVAANLP